MINKIDPRNYFTDYVLGCDVPNLHAALKEELDKQVSGDQQPEMINLIDSLDMALSVAKRKFGLFPDTGSDQPETHSLSEFGEDDDTADVSFGENLF
jgi:hypothetical protein